MLIAGWMMLIAALIHVILFMRYLDRLPEDTLGVWLHIIVIILLLITATLFFIVSRREHGGEA